ncbi:MAG: hypothetical protein RW306_09515 [Geobacteraceae bacterium]|nr:hypothetical protein [Geobacteraceae bacterium]
MWRSAGSNRRRPCSSDEIHSPRSEAVSWVWPSLRSHLLKSVPQPVTQGSLLLERSE